MCYRESAFKNSEDTGLEINRYIETLFMSENPLAVYRYTIYREDLLTYKNKQTFHIMNDMIHSSKIQYIYIYIYIYIYT